MIRLFRVSIPASIVALVASETLLLAGCYVLSAFFALDALIDPSFYLRYENGWIQVAFVVVSIQLGLYFMDLYESPFPRSRTLLVQQLCLVLGVAFLFQAIIGYGEWSLLQLPQWTMVYGSGLVLVVIPLWRVFFFHLVRRAIPSKRILFLGLPAPAQEIVLQLRDRPEMGFTVVGYLDREDIAGTAAYLGTPADLGQAAEAKQPHAIIVGLEEEGQKLPTQKLLELRIAGTEVQHVSDLYEAVFGRISILSLNPAQPVFSEEFSPRPWTLLAQTGYSYVLGVVGLILSLPLIAVSALLVKLSSPGPVLYRQKRVGLRGKPFLLYKFRSMYTNAEARTGPVWASKDDPRITPIGRWMRKLRLDELPQFFNVIRGEMALVGPRPERPEFCAILKEQIPYYQQRHLVKPGITGWAQINHKYTDTIEDAVTKLEYDLYYVKHLAPALDVFIIFHTAKVMLLSRGSQ